jgi:SNF2 family DNA or RNA helicase
MIRSHMTQRQLDPAPPHLTTKDLSSYLDWTTPGLLGSLPDFQRELAGPIERDADAQATERLSRLIAPFLLRRRKTDPGIAPELPAKTETDLLVPLTTEQASLYKAVADDGLARIQADPANKRTLILRLLHELKQVCNHPAQYLHEPGPLTGRSGKLDALDDLLEVIKAESESALVFTQYVQMGRLIERHLAARGIRTLFLHGRSTDRGRRRRRVPGRPRPRRAIAPTASARTAPYRSTGW